MKRNKTEDTESELQEHDFIRGGDGSSGGKSGDGKQDHTASSGIASGNGIGTGGGGAGSAVGGGSDGDAGGGGTTEEGSEDGEGKSQLLALRKLLDDQVWSGDCMWKRDGGYSF